MMKKLLFSLFLCLFAVPLSAQQSEAEHEAMYYIRKAYSLSREGRTEESFKALKLFETYLDQNLSPETTSDSLAIYYAHTLDELLIRMGEGKASSQISTVNWQTVYTYGIRLSKGNNPIGQNILGKYYRHHKWDYLEAIKWYRKAAEQGLADAQNNLGFMYSKGNGVSKDYTEAVKWYRKAAEQGHSRAQNNLGWMYQYGWGIESDVLEAVKWYRKAAEQGEAAGQINLGHMYARGMGVPRNYTEAAKWYRKAADLGDAEGQSNLGYLFYKGYGVTKDYAEALKWYRRAVDQGYEPAKRNMEELLKEMQQQK